MKLSNIGHLVLRELQKNYQVKKQNIGAGAILKGNNLLIETQSYEIEKLGHLCILTMSGLMGLLRMETVVLSVREKDVPLIKMDAVQFASFKSRTVGLYDTLLSPLDGELERLCTIIKKKDSDLKDYEAEDHWVSSVKLPFSYAKATNRKSTRTELSSMKYLQAFLMEAENAEACDPAAKAEKIRSFAQGFLNSDEPMVVEMRRMFGDQPTERLVLDDMFGVKAEASTGGSNNA